MFCFFLYHLGFWSTAAIHIHLMLAIFHSMYLSTITSSLFQLKGFFSSIFIPPSLLPFPFSVYVFFQIELNLNPTWENLWKRNPYPNDSIEDEWICVLYTRIKRTKLRHLIISVQSNRVASSPNHYCMYISLPLNELEVKKHCWNFSFCFLVSMQKKQVLRHSRINTMYVCYKKE